MKAIFDYLFYSLYDFCIKKSDNSEDAIDKACYALSLIQILLVYDILMLIKWFFPFTLSVPKLVFVAIGCLIYLLFEKLNFRHYDGRVLELKEKYKSHPANRWFRIWMYFVIYFGLFFLPFILSSVISLIVD